jgi:hypothetical protein
MLRVVRVFLLHHFAPSDLYFDHCWMKILVVAKEEGEGQERSTVEKEEGAWVRREEGDLI